MTTRIPVGVFFALFTVSGFAGLIYESIWSHYLKLFLGHAAYAQTLVLAIFMGGMALGSWLVSRFTDRLRNLLLGYALAELGIGLLAIVFHPVFLGLQAWAFDTVIPALGGSAAVDAFKWTLASLLILPASVLLGTTFPLMSAGILRIYPDESGRALSMLYFTNSLGASIGVLASGFLLIRELGLPGTILTAGIMNVALAIFVWGLTKRIPELPATPSQARQGEQASRSAGRAILVLAFVTGAASFIYEITWIRMLSLGLGASTHAFEVMLAAFILGMSLGGFALRNRINVLANDAGWLSGILVAKGLFAIAAIWVYGYVLEFLTWVMTGLAPTDAGYAFVSLAGLVASILVMVPTAFCAGMTLPLATHALIRRGHGERAIGAVYGANTLGCIFGAAFTTHVGMELLGVKGLTGMGALLDVGIGAVLVLVLAGDSARRAALPRIGMAIAAGAVAFSIADLDLLRMSSGIFRSGRFLDPQYASVDWYRDGKTATISVIHEQTVLAIRTNGKPDASIELVDRTRPTADEATMVLAAAIPLAMKPDAAQIANIGFGSGLTTHALLGSPRARVVDSIEIERAMIEGARAFGKRNARAYSDPRSRIHIEDAKTFFAANGKTYDIIVSEPSNPWVSGVSTLFSEEFYAQVRRYLKDDGLLVQWIQVYEINAPLVATVFRALGTSFSDYVIHVSSAGDMIVVAAKTGKVPELRDDILRFPGLAEDLAMTGFRTLTDLQGTRIAGRRSLDPLFLRLAAVANSDFFPILDQNAARSRFRKESAIDLQMLGKAPASVIPFIEGDRRVRRSSLPGDDPVAPSLARRHAEIAAEAWDIFLTGTSKGPRRLDPLGRTEFLLARAGLTDCSVADEMWFEALEDFFRTTIPILAREDMQAAFDLVARSPCLKRLDADQRQRLELWWATNALDGAAMAKNAKALLEAEVKRKPAERMHLVLAAMVGEIVTGDAASAVRIWNREVGRITEQQVGHVSSQLVLAHALRARSAQAGATAPPR